MTFTLLKYQSLIDQQWVLSRLSKIYFDSVEQFLSRYKSALFLDSLCDIIYCLKYEGNVTCYSQSFHMSELRTKTISDFRFSTEPPAIGFVSTIQIET